MALVFTFWASLLFSGIYIENIAYAIRNNKQPSIPVNIMFSLAVTGWTVLFALIHNQ